MLGWLGRARVRLGLYFQLERGRFPPPDFHFALLSFHWNFQGKYTFTLRAVQEILEIPFCPPPLAPINGLVGASGWPGAPAALAPRSGRSNTRDTYA